MKITKNDLINYIKTPRTIIYETKKSFNIMQIYYNQNIIYYKTSYNSIANKDIAINMMDKQDYHVLTKQQINGLLNNNIIPTPSLTKMLLNNVNKHAIINKLKKIL